MPLIVFFFFFNDTATTEIYTLSLHDALPISVEDDLALVHLDLVVLQVTALGVAPPDTEFASIAHETGSSSSVRYFFSSSSSNSSSRSSRIGIWSLRTTFTAPSASSEQTS